MSERRIVAYIGQVSGPPRTRHTIRNESAGADELMPPAQVVLIEAESDGSAQVYRYTLDGEFAGDTWHQSLQEAHEQLVFEFDSSLGPFSDVPDDVDDAHEYAVGWARTSRPEA